MVQVVTGCPRRVHAGSNVCLIVCCLFLAVRCSTCLPCSLHTAVQYAAVSVPQWNSTCATRLPAAACWLATACAARPGTHIFDAALLGSV